MKELGTIENYTELKETLREELNNQSLGFVRTGYLLKRARDTGMIEEGGYKTVFEFAEAEYGLKKDVVSRYIAINDRYSEGGYSDKLQEQFREYGVGKLQDMLTLPLEVVNMISPKMTRSEIGEIKAEVRAEEATTPLELLMEGKNGKQYGMDICQKAMHQYCHDYPQKFLEMSDAFKEETDHDTAVKLILDAMAPSGIKAVTVRVQGEGRFMISFQGESAPVEILKVKNGEHMELQWTEFIVKLREILKSVPGTEGAEWWENIYQEAYPQEEKEIPEKGEDGKKEETVPAQQKPSHVTKEKVEKLEPEERQQDQNEEQPETVEVVPGIYAEIKDMDKAEEAANLEMKKAEIQAVPSHTKEETSGETETPEVAPVQQNPESTETPERQQDNREEILSGEVEDPSDRENTQHETDSVKMTEAEFHKRMEEYREAFREELEGAGRSIEGYSFALTRRFLEDATNILDKMDQLDDEYEEYYL